MTSGKLKRIPLVGPMLSRLAVRLRGGLPFISSEQYWEERYKRGGNSGAGSYNNLAEFKAEILNRFVAEQGIRSVTEFGCGDGNQLKLFRFPSYTGYDVSSTAIEQCRRQYRDDPSRQFFRMDAAGMGQADLTLSLDVIYHLVEDPVFETYMQRLFDTSARFVIIYSTDVDDPEESNMAEHVRNRKFTDWVAKHRPDFLLTQHIPNRYPFNGNGEETSAADFYIFEKQTSEP